MLPCAKVGGGYLNVTNNGETHDRLSSATSEQASSIQLSRMKIHGGIMVMRKLQDGIAIPKGELVELKSAGYHDVP